MMNAARQSVDVKPMSPLVAAGNAMGGAEDLIRRLRSVVDRLVGPVPEAVGEAYPPVSDYLLPALETRASSLMEAVIEGNRALDRLESVL